MTESLADMGDWAAWIEDSDDSSDESPTITTSAIAKAVQDSESDDGESDMIQQYLNKNRKTVTKKTMVKETPKHHNAQHNWADASSRTNDNDDDGFTTVTKKKGKGKGKGKGKYEYNKERLDKSRHANVVAEDNRLKQQSHREKRVEQVTTDYGGYDVMYNAPNPKPSKFSSHCHIIYFNEDDHDLRSFLMYGIKNIEEVSDGRTIKYKRIVHEEMSAPECVNVSLFHWHDDPYDDTNHGALMVCFGKNRKYQTYNALEEGVHQLIDFFNSYNQICDDAKSEAEPVDETDDEHDDGIVDEIQAEIEADIAKSY
jgi:hypothetical protein